MADPYRFVRNWGDLFLAFAVLSAWHFYLLSNMPDAPAWFRYFAITMGSYYALTGFGLLKYRLWGFWGLLAFLYFCLLAFPVGTAIGYFALRYIRRNRVKEWFRSRIGDGMRDIAQL